MTTSTKRRWFSFSLRTLLIAMTVLAIWLGLYVKSFRERRAAVAAVEQLEGSFYLKPIGQKWLQPFVSDEKYLWNPYAVRFNPDHPIGDDELQSMTPHMLKFDMYDLNLYRSDITDDGLAHILPLADRLYSLDIRDTAITDDGIPYLLEFRKLIVLRLGSRSRITAEGLNEIRSSLPNCHIDSDSI